MVEIKVTNREVESRINGTLEEIGKDASRIISTIHQQIKIKSETDAAIFRDLMWMMMAPGSPVWTESTTAVMVDLTNTKK